jgi:hypothetical protein
MLGIKALDGAHHDEAAHHFPVNSSAPSLNYILEIYEDFIVVHQDQNTSYKCALCPAVWKGMVFLAGQLEEALGSHKYMMKIIDETARPTTLNIPMASLQ